MRKVKYRNMRFRHEYNLLSFFLNTTTTRLKWPNGNESALNLQKYHARYKPINLKR